jgi:hypothetical protein
VIFLFLSLENSDGPRTFGFQSTIDEGESNFFLNRIRLAAFLVKKSHVVGDPTYIDTKRKHSAQG